MVGRQPLTTGVEAMSKRELDFLIIGAQKAGTTSLFKYINNHPQVFMPAAKECPYFNSEEMLRRGWDVYLDQYFKNAPINRLWGTATPEYMVQPAVPERIKALLPNVKLIALLRNPVERAFSHYRMSVRRGYETRSFDVAIQEQLLPHALITARGMPDHTNSYVVNSEYGRILREYFRLFSNKQISVHFLEDMQIAPQDVVKKIFSFLDVTSEFIPPNIGEIYHRGGRRRRWSELEMLRAKMKGIRPVLALWRILPRRMTDSISYWMEQWNVVREKETVEISIETHKMLTGHFLRDAHDLEKLIGRVPVLR